MPSVRPSSRLCSSRLCAVGWSPRAGGDSPEHAQRQHRPPARAGGLQSGGALIVERLGAGNVALFEQYLCHEGEVHCRAHVVAQSVIDAAGLLEQRPSTREVTAEAQDVP